MVLVKILIVEDDDEHRRYIGDVLRSEGYQVMEAGNMTVAREKFRTETGLGLIILDQMLPEGYGTTLYDEIQKTDSLAELPVLFITAYPEDAALVKVGRNKNVAVLSKPIQYYADIVNEVEELLARHNNRPQPRRGK